MSRGPTNSERLAILETRMDAQDETDRALLAEMREMKQAVNASLEFVETAQSATDKRLDGLQNTGKGMLIGVGLIAAVVGGTLWDVVERVLGLQN